MICIPPSDLFDMEELSLAICLLSNQTGPTCAGPFDFVSIGLIGFTQSSRSLVFLMKVIKTRETVANPYGSNVATKVSSLEFVDGLLLSSLKWKN